MKLESSPTPYTKLSRWIIVLNIKFVTSKLSKEYTGKMLLGIGLDSTFLNMTSKSQVKNKKIQKCDYIKL